MVSKINTSKMYAFLSRWHRTVPKPNFSFHFQVGSSDSAHIAVGGGDSGVEAAAAAAATPCVAWEGTVKVRKKRERIW